MKFIIEVAAGSTNVFEESIQVFHIIFQVSANLSSRLHFTLIKETEFLEFSSC